jgi:(S)-ureidoglycine aminohydrolase
MRTIQQLVHSRARVRQRYALFPLEGFPNSVLPLWPGCEARVLCAPPIGAGFAMYLIDVPAGRGSEALTDGLVETFLYVRSGAIELPNHPRGETAVQDHSVPNVGKDEYVFIPADWAAELVAKEPAQLVVVRKRYEPPPPHPLDDITQTATFVLGSLRIEAKPFMGNAHARLQTLLPDDLRFDMAMNVFAFDAGHGLPYVETHVMEHGLLMLEGKGLYYLDGEWMEVEKDDFIWMGPYCPQSFYATGPTPARYLYYKNVNRDIPL